MSRIGFHPVILPDKVTAEVEDGTVRVKGPRGELSIGLPEGITTEAGEGTLLLNRRDDSREMKRFHGTFKRHVENMVTGVSEGHRRELVASGKGYQAEVKGKVVEMQVGFSHKVLAEIPEGLSVEVAPGQNTFTLKIEGIDKHLVGAFASTIYGIRPVEPYNMIGFRYSDQHVRRKAAKIATT
jgi:large subunit ribosomal protein L6